MKMRTISKPWGQEEIIEINPKYMFKRLTMLKGKKDVVWYIIIIKLKQFMS